MNTTSNLGSIFVDGSVNFIDYVLLTFKSGEISGGLLAEEGE